MTEDQKNARQNIRIQSFVTAIAVLLFALKFAAWYMTHSVAIYTDALESIANIVAGFFGLYSLHFAARPRDTSHPYGHGKIEFISAAIEGTFITIAGFVILFRIGDNLRNHAQLEKLDMGLALISVTAIINYAIGFIAVRVGRKNNSLALIASGKHMQTDTFSTLGIMAGIGLVLATGIIWIDNLTALVAAILIMATGVKIIRHAVAGILDEADPQLIREIVAYLNEHRRENWIDLHNFRVIKYGSILHIDAHMTVPRHLTISQGHDELKEIEAIVKQKYGQSVEMFIHLDPGPENYKELHRVEWTVDYVLQRYPKKYNLNSSVNTN